MFQPKAKPLLSLAEMALRARLPAMDPWFAALAITGVTADSRLVAPGYLFAALPGATHDGSAYIAEAVARGAAAGLAQGRTRWPPGVPPRPMITDTQPRRALARLAAARAGRQPAHVAAVTGTNGKTSTVDFLRQLWAASGRPAASIGTLGLIAPGEAGGAGLTTPDAVALAEMMARLAGCGVQHAAIEASSHGLDQFRLDGLRFAAAGFTNFTRDHLDYHADEAAYRRAKLRLFSEVLPPGAVAVVNADMQPETLAALRDIAGERKLVLRSVGEDGRDMRLVAAAPLPHGQALDIESNGKRVQVEVALPGRFQADNVLMAACLAESSGLHDALGLVHRLTGVRGRMELAARLPNGAAAYVDYAHTPDALARLLAALRPHTVGRLICVFGAGGDRDAGKRPLMGEAVANLADAAIVTDDNPRSENAAQIRGTILRACPLAREIGDRAHAIEAGLAALRTGDVLVVAGKGHEQGQIVGRDILPFDDADMIRRLAA